MNIPLITLPILWTIICALAFLLWPCKRCTGDYGIDLTPVIIAFFSFIAALIGWIVYLALK